MSELGTLDEREREEERMSDFETGVGDEEKLMINNSVNKGRK